MSGSFKSTKSFWNFPCTHRQHLDQGHCRFVHGYSRSFHFEFSCTELDEKGWVVDFGGLKDIKAWLEYTFDHTFLINQDDPLLPKFQELHEIGGLDLRVLPCVSMEGTSKFVYDYCQPIIHKLYGDRCWISKVEVRENDKNSGMYIP